MKWHRMEVVLAIGIIIMIAILGKQCYDLPVPKWKAGDRICIKHNNSEGVVFSTYRYSGGVTYYLTAFDNLNHGYELKLPEESLKDCTTESVK